MARTCGVAILMGACAYGCGGSDGGDSSSSGGGSSAGGEAGGAGGAGEPTVNGGGGSGEQPADCIKRGPIEEDTTWEPLSSCEDGFEVPSLIEIKGSGTVLTVEPGTKLKFAQESGIEVADNAALTAVGTADDPIIFTGWQELEGSWRGITFHSSALSNEISNAVVEYAGAAGGASANVSISSDGPGRVKLTATTLQHSAQFGLTVLDGGALGEFADNTITDNKDGAIRVGVTSVDQLTGTGNTLEANGNDNTVRIETSILNPLVTEVAWPNLSPAIYRVTDAGGDAGADIFVKAHLTIEAGAIFEFAGGSGIDVSDGTSGLSAIGTAAAPIIFRGVDGSGWKGIGFCESNWTGNALEHVEVHNAKGPPDAWSYCGTGASAALDPGILVGHNFAANAAQLRVKNITVAGPNNAAADITVKAPSTLTQEGSNVGTSATNKLVIEAI